jgi:hypothetical protein
MAIPKVAQAASGQGLTAGDQGKLSVLPAGGLAVPWDGYRKFRYYTVQDGGIGEVFVECIEKTGFPGVGFSPHGEIGVWLSPRRLSPKLKGAKNYTLQDQKLAAGCRIPASWEPKRKSRFQSRDMVN